MIDGIVSQGAVMFKNPERDDRSSRTLVDCFKILLANPYTGKNYSSQHYYYWAVCYKIGFDKYGPQAVNTFKMEMVREYDNEIRFTDQHGNEFVLEPIDQDDESAGSIFRKWLAYKEKKADIFEGLYDDYTRETLEMIRYWESGI